MEHKSAPAHRAGALGYKQLASITGGSGANAPRITVNLLDISYICINGCARNSHLIQSVGNSNAATCRPRTRTKGNLRMEDLDGREEQKMKGEVLK